MVSQESEKIARIICIGEFGTDGNSEKYVAEKVFEISGVLDVSNILILCKLVAKFSLQQPKPIFSR